MDFNQKDIVYRENEMGRGELNRDDLVTREEEQQKAESLRSYFSVLLGCRPGGRNVCSGLSRTAW